jgi:hypothetical protein
MKMTKTKILTALSAITLALVIAPTASADTVTVTGSGTWDASTPTTAYSASDATWSFSFNLPDTISSNPSTQVTNFTYDLNGTQVTDSLPGGVLFYSVAQSGGFDLFVPTDSVSGASIISLFFSADVGSSLSIVYGTNDAQIALNDGELPGSGEGAVSITPEPPSILLFGTALLLAGGLFYRRRNESYATQSE